MGCVQSKNEIPDNQLNVFRVVNIDENGADLCSGQLEITESDILLLREGRDCTVWPMHSLRRYGFEGEIFSFESGRRCETGEGIYAFRCRRAASLFQLLQQQIQLRNVSHDPAALPVQSRLTVTHSPQARQTLQASVVHRSSIDGGVDSHLATQHSLPQVTSPRALMAPQSPSSPFNDILEVMPLNSWSHSNNNHVTNVYQLREFKKDHSNSSETSPHSHVYSNDLNRDLAFLRSNLRENAIINNIRDIEEESSFLQSRYVNETLPKTNKCSLLSPTVSVNSESYAQLSTEPDARMYVNINTNDLNNPIYKNEHLPTTPQTPKPVEYSNLSVGAKFECNSYANLSLADMPESRKIGKPIISVNIPKCSESDTLTSISPIEELEVNYAVLDIDKQKAESKIIAEQVPLESKSPSSSQNNSINSHESQSCDKLVSQKSIEKQNNPNSAAMPANVGYTTIDFEKTVALTSVVAFTDVTKDEKKKIRHSSSNLFCGSSNAKK